MRAIKLTTFIKVFLATFGIALIFAPQTFARSYDTTVHLNGQLSGQYGAYVPNSYYRYQTFNSYTPVELLTGVSQRSKYLYGTSVSFNVSLDDKDTHYMQFNMKFSSNGADVDFYNINEHYLGFKTSATSTSYSEFTNTMLCQVNTYSQVQIRYMDVTCEVTFTDGVVPVAILYQYGSVGNFTHEVTSPIAISTGSSIFLQDVSYSWSSGGSGDDSGAINNLGDTMEDIHNDEKDTINDSVNDAENDAGSMDTSGWSLINPLNVWLGMFNNNTCVSIPTIKDWLNGVESSVCSPWDVDVRNVVTPVVSILGSMVVFGLVIRWLKNGGTTS